MASITVSAQDIQDARTFLTAYASAQVPDADFTEGSATNDLVIKAIAAIFAFLRKEQATTRSYQSLLALSKLPPSSDVDAAVDAYLSNWFLTRKSGRTSTVPVVLHFSRQADVVLQPTTRLYKTTSLSFVPDIPSTLVVSASDLTPVVNADGTITDYTYTVTAKSEDGGIDANITPGRFVSADQFSPYFTYAENTVAGKDGLDIETTAEMLSRSSTAISTRNLVNSRSINTVLLDKFVGLSAVFVAGFGDPEMMRDYVEGLAGLKMHLGGCTDIYVSLSRTDVTESGLLIGGVFVRPDGVVNVLNDGTVDFVAQGVQPYDVLQVTVGLDDAPRQFLVKTVNQHEIEVLERTPFANDGAHVTYTIGNISPGFDNKVGSAGALTTGVTASTLQQPNRVLLTGRPHYKIKKVEVVNGTSITALSNRLNSGTPGLGDYLVTILNPYAAQSSQAVCAIDVNAAYNGQQLRVTYETLVGYSDIQTLVVDPFERTNNASQLVRGLNPVYVSAVFSYKLKNGALDTVDPADVATAIASYINTFDPTNNIDSSELKAYIRNTFPDIGAILEPFQLTYSLIAPDGQLYTFSTLDIVSIAPAYPLNNAKLTNGLSLRLPISNADLDPTLSAANETLVKAANATLGGQLRQLGVSDRNIRYFCEAADITATLVS